MGKAQSKRSVDITTDTKKAAGEGDEVAGKVEKIEDVDQKEATNAAAAVNGDATPQEKNDAEKKETPEEGSENDKDLTTEKNAEAAAAASTADGSGDTAAATPNTPDAEQKEAAAAASGAEEISPLTDDSKSKTPSAKKDKVKKKWSFRSISFGKKDKQKPAKSDEATTAAATATATADAAVTNGDAEKTEAGTKQPDEAAGGATSAVAANEETKPTENGVASEQEAQLNGDKTPSPTSEKQQQQQQQQQSKQNEINESSNTNNATESTITTAPTATPPSPPAAATAVAAIVAVAAADSNNETAKDTAANAVETVAVAVSVAVAETNAAAAAAAAAAATAPTHVSNGNAATDEVCATNAAADANADDCSSKASIPSVTNDAVASVEKPQQNGTNGEAEHDDVEQPVAPASNINELLATDAEQIKIKSQIEVNNIVAAEQYDDDDVNDNDHDNNDVDSVKVAAVEDMSAIVVADVSVSATSYKQTTITAKKTAAAAELDQTQEFPMTTTTTTITTDTFESSSIMPTTTISDNIVQVVQEISQEEEEAQVVASIIAAVSEDPTEIVSTDNDTATDSACVVCIPDADFAEPVVVTDEQDHQQQQQLAQQQRQESEQIQTVGEGVVCINVNVNANDNDNDKDKDNNNDVDNDNVVEIPEELSPPPPPLPVSLPPSQVSVFAFKDNSESSSNNDDTTTNTTENTTTNIDVHQIETLPQLAEVSKPESTVAAENESPVAQDSVIADDVMQVLTTTSTTTHVVVAEEKEKEQEAETHLTVEPKTTENDFIVIDESEANVTVDNDAANFTKTVTIADAVGETAAAAAAATGVDDMLNTDSDKLMQLAKNTAEEFVAEITNRAGEMAMQKLLEAAAIKDLSTVEDVNDDVDDVDDDDDVQQRLPTPPPSPSVDEFNNILEDAAATTINTEQSAADELLHASGDAAQNGQQQQQQQQNVADVAANDDENNVDVDDDDDQPASTLDMNSIEKKGIIEIVTKQSNDNANTTNIATMPTTTTTTFELDDSSNKDIANAKDLMENVAAEITTQELTALTCE